MNADDMHTQYLHAAEAARHARPESKPIREQEAAYWWARWLNTARAVAEAEALEREMDRHERKAN